MELSLDWTPFPWQDRAMLKLRHTTLVCVARQTGKTAMLKAVLLGVGLKTEGLDYGFITPTLKRTGEVFRQIVDGLPGDLAEIRKVDKQIIFHDRRVAFHFGSTEQAKGHRGGTFGGLIFDECQLMDGATVRQTFLPMLSATAGWRIFCGTPPGLLDAPDPYFFENLMAEFCQRFGVDVNDFGEWADDEVCVVHHNHKIRSETDPNYKRSVEDAKANSPEDEFDREYGARFVKPGEGQLKETLLQDYVAWADLIGQPMDVRIHLDPSFGETEASDPRAIVAVGLTPDGDLKVLDVRQGRWDYSAFSDQIFLCHEWCCQYGWRPSYVSLETNGPGAYFLRTLMREMETRNIHLPLQPRHHAKSKYERILTLEPWLRDKRIWIQRKRYEYCRAHLHWPVKEETSSYPGMLALVKQMRDFPRGLLHKNVKMDHHYDVLDALSHSTQDFLPPPKRSTPVVEVPSGKLILSFADAVKEAKRPRRRRGWAHARH